MSRVAVIGAGGYVGPHLCRALLEHGHEVVGIGRPHARIALEPIGVPVAPGIGEGPRFDVVINLAYPTTGPARGVPGQNQRLLAQMRDVASSGGRVIHVSTLAVFGFSLESEPRLGPVTGHRDFPYIESKVDLERRAWRAFRSHDAHIVRLGNVWGPASPNWTAALAQAVLFGLPTGVAGADGYSNVTDVANVAALLTALVEAPAVDSLRFHHLAEHSGLRWSHWVGLLASELGLDPVLATIRPGYATSFWPEFRAALRPGSPLAVYRRCVYGRLTGSWLRSVLRLVPAVVFETLKRRVSRRSAQPSPAEDLDPVLMELLACSREFRTAVGVPWTPPVDADQSWTRVRDWMHVAGYADSRGSTWRS